MIPENGAKKREGKGHLSGGLFPPVNTGNVGKVRRLLTASQMKIGFVRDSKQDVAISGYSINVKARGAQLAANLVNVLVEIGTHTIGHVTGKCLSHKLAICYGRGTAREQWLEQAVLGWGKPDEHMIDDHRSTLVVVLDTVDSNGGTVQKRSLHHASFHSTLTIR